MADLQFVDFALMPGPVREEEQFGLPDDFFPRFFTTRTRTDHCSAIRNFFTQRGRSKKFQHFRSQR